MAKIDYIKLSQPRDDGKAELLVRLYVNRTLRPQLRSGIFINPERFVSLDKTNRCRHYEIDVPRPGTLNYLQHKEAKDAKNKFAAFLAMLMAICDATAEKHKDDITADWIEQSLRLVNNHNVNPADVTYNLLVELAEKERQEIEHGDRPSFFDSMADFRDNAKKKVNGRREGEKSEVWKKNFNVLVRALERYERFVGASDKRNRNFKLDIDTIDTERLEDIESYLRNEHELLESYPNIYKDVPANTDGKRKSPKPQPRSNNTICALLNKLRAFFNWLNEQKVTTNNPFVGFVGTTTERYGTPIYISLAERNHIADFDLSSRPALAVQRDIFIFQCCIGCRVSDLLRLTDSNVIDGAIEYIPSKTKAERQKVVRVPLNGRATALLQKYRGTTRGGKLLPFISAQKYNDAIKEIFTACGITRLVTTLDGISGREIQRPINEIASSHMARRCFVGNLYKQVKDPSLIAPMSGHAEGSRAFNRYREIDEDMKRELVSLIE